MKCCNARDSVSSPDPTHAFTFLLSRNKPLLSPPCRKRLLFYRPDIITVDIHVLVYGTLYISGELSHKVHKC